MCKQRLRLQDEEAEVARTAAVLLTHSWKNGSDICFREVELIGRSGPGFHPYPQLSYEDIRRDNFAITISYMKTPGQGIAP